MSNKEIIEETEIEVEETEIERPFTLRKLKDGDLIPLLQLFRKVGLKDFKGALMQVADGKSAKEVGVVVILEMADIIIENISGSAGDDIYAFWSELSGIPAEEIKDMEFGTLPLMIYDSFNEVKNSSFFKVLSKLL